MHAPLTRCYKPRGAAACKAVLRMRRVACPIANEVAVTQAATAKSVANLQWQLHMRQRQQVSTHIRVGRVACSIADEVAVTQAASAESVRNLQ